MVDHRKKVKRKRGVILSQVGWQRLQAALTQLEKKTNGGHPYSLETLGELTNLSSHTLIKVRRREAPVDRQTLAGYFEALKLELTSEDYVKPDTISNRLPSSGQGVETSSGPSAGTSAMSGCSGEVDASSSDPSSVRPEGQLPVNSWLYINRPPVEADCYKAIEQAGALIRIKAPRRMGKTSLMMRILNHSQTLGYKTVSLNLQLAERELFQDLTRFLQWFSVSVGRALELPNQLTDYWDDMFGSKMSCKIYFEQYLLANQSQPVVLALDDVDRLFQYPDLADEFFGLLRTWHEDAKNRDIWKQLRLIVAHSTEVYIPLNVNKSPFNVGIPFVLKPLTVDQVEELSQRYGLNWTPSQTNQLITLTNGHPYLIQVALYALWTRQMSLGTVLQTATTPASVYSDHLQRQYWLLEQDPELEAAFSQVLSAPAPISLDLPQAFRLESMGLVRLQDNQVIPHCALYNQYFSDRLSLSTP